MFKRPSKLWLVWLTLWAFFLCPAMAFSTQERGPFSKAPRNDGRGHTLGYTYDDNGNLETLSFTHIFQTTDFGHNRSIKD